MAGITTGKPEEKKEKGGYTQRYTGGDAALDSAIKGYSDKYFEARAAGDAAGMREANDAANQLRNQYGYAAELAHEDIAKAMAKSAGSGNSTGIGGGAAAPERTQLSAPADYSGYIEEMNRAKQEAALNELRAAYEKNMASLDRTREEIAPAYQQARNQAAGASEQAGRQFAAYAAAQGLNSGAGGQAELARQNTLQGSLNTLDTQEASKLADLELQRSQAQTEYNNAIASARAQGNYTLASQLYQEKVRVDEALRQRQLEQAQLNLQNWQAEYQVDRDRLTDQRYQDELAYGRSQDQYAKEADRAGLLAEIGDFSGYGALWGLSGEQTAALVAQYAGQKQTSQSQAARELASWYAQYGDFSKLAELGVDTGYLTAGTARTSGGARSFGSPTGERSYEGIFRDAYASGYPESYLANNYKRYGFTSREGLYGAYVDWKQENTSGIPEFESYQGAAEYLRQKGRSAAGLMTRSEWNGHRNSGNDESGASLYGSYRDYLSAYVLSQAEG